jgi:hypothetical protein
MWGGAVTFLLPLFVYAISRAPGLTFVDSGELAAAAATLGIAHPTGYPLFTVLGRVLVAPAGPLEPIERLILFSAACTAAAAALVFSAARRLLNQLGMPPQVAVASAAGGSLAFAFGRTVWGQAVIVEVYALHLLFVALLLRIAVGVMAERAARDTGRSILLGSYLGGLALGNHLSAALLLPALAYGVVREHGMSIVRRLWPALVLAFVGGTTLIAVLPVRSALDPLLDWGDPERLDSFYRHVTGSVYRVWFLSSPAVAVRQLGRFFDLLAVEMTPLALGPAILGLVHLWRRWPAFAHTSLLLFLPDHLNLGGGGDGVADRAHGARAALGAGRGPAHRRLGRPAPPSRPHPALERGHGQPAAKPSRSRLHASHVPVARCPRRPPDPPVGSLLLGLDL